MLVVSEAIPSRRADNAVALVDESNLENCASRRFQAAGVIRR